MADADGQVLAGRYRLVHRLGAGGFGEVWRGVDERLEREVAVKVLLGGADPQAARLFEREAKLGAKLAHPGITVVHDVGVDSSRWFVVMELLGGRDLAAVLATSPQGLEITEVAEWGAQVAEALAVAHAAGIVHRDIKPANLMLLDGGRIKVCDFGIARAAGATASVTAQGYASLAYAAPEQLSNETVDARADLYSLGCTLYHLMTGRPPFSGDTPMAILAGHLSRTPDLPSSLRAEIPSALDEILLELLAKSPAQRPDDATVLAARLRAAAAGQHPPGARTRRMGSANTPDPQVEGAVFLGTMDWNATAQEFRGRDYQTFTAVFLPGKDTRGASVWGDGIYTDDSSIGLAAVHAGIISLRQGGTVTFQTRPGRESYAGAKRNGVWTSAWGSWSGSFVFPLPQPAAHASRPVTEPVFLGVMDWGATAASFRGRNDEIFTVILPPGGNVRDGNVWGDGIYTDDSSIGLAAVHAGIISLRQGGTVTFQIRPGRESYAGAKRNGVKTSTWGSWSGSFAFH
ncbi:protein kinase domain-containing protein [Actinomadura miaoliensis]|uniref:non-specific serine/threonine protein kinase n=1 Tax=Actinomadura miaoliensis TaxID=430685 RepID=A0ABP7WBU8_9ACTN